MDLEPVYTRTMQGVSGTTRINIPLEIVKKMNIKKGQTAIIGNTKDVIVIKPLPTKIDGKDIPEYSNYEARLDGTLDQSKNNPLDSLDAPNTR